MLGLDEKVYHTLIKNFKTKYLENSKHRTLNNLQFGQQHHQIRIYTQSLVSKEHRERIASILRNYCLRIKGGQIISNSFASPHIF